MHSYSCVVGALARTYFHSNQQDIPGSRDSLLVRAPDSRSKGCEFESRQEQPENFLLQSQLCVLTLIRCPFHPRVTAVARKRLQVILPKVQVAGYT